MLQSLSVFLCSAAPCDKNFLPSFTRQVRKHLFPVPQKKKSSCKLSTALYRHSCAHAWRKRHLLFRALTCSSVEQLLKGAGSSLCVDFLKYLVKFFFLFVNF